MMSIKVVNNLKNNLNQESNPNKQKDLRSVISEQSEKSEDPLNLILAKIIRMEG